MRRFFIGVGIIVTSLASLTAHASSFSGRGYVEDSYHHGVGGASNSGHRFEALLESRVSQGDWSLNSVLLGRYRTQYDDVGGKLESRMKSDQDLRELYLTWAGDDWQWQIGQQQISWGRGDYFRLVDVLNPLDLREFLLPYLADYSLGRRTRPMAVVETYGSSLEQQWVFAPQAKTTRYAPAGAEFAIAGRPEGLPKDDSHQRPDLGWRGKTFVAGTDLDFYLFDGLSPDPLYVEKHGRLVEQQRRRSLVGSSFARPAGNWVVRADLAHMFNEPLQTPTGAENLPKTAALLGLDLIRNELTLNLQITVSHRHGAADGLNRKTGQEASVAVLRDWSRQRLNAGIVWLYQREVQSSHMVKTSLGYRPWNHWYLEAGYIGFSGSEATQFGQFDDRDRFYLQLRRNFNL